VGSGGPRERPDLLLKAGKRPGLVLKVPCEPMRPLMLKVRSGQVRTREGWRDRNSRCEHTGKRSGERGGLDDTTMRRVLISQNVLPLFVLHFDSPRMPIAKKAKG
jgi:hypothetical protein